MFLKNEDGKMTAQVQTSKRRIVPLLPLRDIIVFPHMVSQLFVGRERSISALDAAMTRDKDIFLAAQKSQDQRAFARGYFPGRYARYRDAAPPSP
jgi:ATP-dependent Lon protease